MAKVTDFRPQTRNANKHTQRGMGRLEHSIEQDGWIGALTVAADGESFDGSARLEVAADKFADTEPIVVETDGTRPVVVKRIDIPNAQDERAVRLGIAANRVAELNLEWDADVLAELSAEIDLSDMFSDKELVELGVVDPEHTMQGSVGGGYAEESQFDNINPWKLAYRLEAAWRAADGVALDLFSGCGELAQFYARRFQRVIRVDRVQYDGVEHVCTAAEWLQKHFADVAHYFTFVDFDHEGSPLREVRQFFGLLPVDRRESFVLCVTDGSALNLKMRGKFDPSLYGLSGQKRQCTADDYEQFEELVTEAVIGFAATAGWNARLWSKARGSENNVLYETFLVER